MRPPSSVLVVTLLALAGCSGTPDSDGGGDGEAACPLVYPDGSPVSCTESSYSSVTVLDAFPAPSTGWTCKDHNGAENGNKHQVWMNADGRLAVAWDYTAAPLEEPATAILVLFQEGADQIMLVPYQTVGFAEFPTPPTSSPMEIHILLYGFRLYVNYVDPFAAEAWQQVDSANATFLASTFGSDPWFAWVFDDGTTTYYVDVMGLDTNEAGKQIYRPSGGLREGTNGEPSLYPVAGGGGAKYPNRDPLQVRVNPGFCYLEDLPV